MLLKELVQLNEAMTADKQSLLDVIYGYKSGPKFIDKLSNWFDGFFIGVKGKVRPAKHIEEILTSVGYSKEQQAKIRDVFTQISKTVVDRLQKKYGEEAIPVKYISTLGSSYGVYTFYLNVDEKYHDELREMVKKLFKMKLEKMPDEDFIPENAKK